MNDKQILELAAKAAGYSTSKYWHNDGIHCSTEYAYTDGPHGWNPLTDDGDALRLAVKLNISLSMESHEIAAHGMGVYTIENQTETYPKLEATRRAITRAAAEIGRAL